MDGHRPGDRENDWTGCVSAASVPQVRGIVNDIRAPGITVDPEEQKILEPSIGREVFATDILLGEVERVIINPHNRRVTSFVAHGNFPDLRHVDEYRFSYEIPQQERSRHRPDSGRAL